ncbi:alpha/beta fold hydrolase [Rhodococcus ruber]|uniref:Alpha/beta fold hydrolase n=1 Tax=Rhodococcus ruber TaxID=1830 RepID=A0ABT4ML89_9NOCA|nr:alpha/beta fold hydrolase [Rhodococcus ruber]MCZ4521754.1 alpha/beta fold hydrolase [Rhodococcus ruber]
MRRAAVGTTPRRQAGVDDLDPAVAAALRALPITRLQDYGLSTADAQLIHESARAGRVWSTIGNDMAAVSLAAAAELRAAGWQSAATERELYAALALNVCQVPVLDPVEKAQQYTRIGSIIGAATTQPGSPWTVIQDGSDGLYSVLARPAGNDPVPTVLMWGGLSGWGISYKRLGDVLVKNGIAVVLLELPGQGMSRLRSSRRLDESFVDDLDALSDDLLSRGATSSIGLLGNSAGGLFAAYAASKLNQVSAVCINSGIPDPASTILRFPRLNAQWAALFGVEPSEVDSAIEPWAFSGDARHRIAGDILVLHGGVDSLVQEHEQEAFLRAANPARSSMVVWVDCGHCIYERYAERDAVISEWFARVLD